MNPKKLLSILSFARRAVALCVGWSMLFAVERASACPFCYGAKDGKSAEHMAVAIWFLFGAVMSVIGGIGAFSYSIWRHGRMPLPPHEELMEEDLEKYE
jgi:hypothetical protein